MTDERHHEYLDENNMIFVQFIDDIDHLINSIKLCSVWNEIKNWIELNCWRQETTFHYGSIASHNLEKQ